MCILICVYVSIRACKRGDEYLMCRKKRGGDGDGGAETPKKCSKTNSPNTNTNIASHSDTTVCAVSRSLSFASLLLLRCAHPSVRLFVCSLLFVLRMSLNLDVMLCCCLPEKASTVENKAKSWFGLVLCCQRMFAQLTRHSLQPMHTDQIMVSNDKIENECETVALGRDRGKRNDKTALANLKKMFVH